MSTLDNQTFNQAFHRGMWAEGLVAALATLAVAWPLTQLLREDTWLVPAVLMVGLVALTGAVLRTIDAPPSVVSLGQLALGLAGLMQLYLRDSLWRGFLPTSETLPLAGELLREAGVVLQTYAAPAPTTEGVAFLVVAVLTLTSISVDSMGVTGRAPASAGIPLAAGFLVSVSNSGQAMEPWYFATVAALWLVMLAQQGHRVVTAWPSESRRESVGSDDVSSGIPRHKGLAQVLGIGALVAAVAGAAAIPHLPPTFFGDGLARNPEAREVRGGTGEVSFTETMDPTQDLRNQSQEPVLTYRTTAPRLEPLRVTSTEKWEDGRWVAPDRDEGPIMPVGEQIPAPEGLSPEVPTEEQTLTVLGNALPAPHLAAPSPLASVRTGNGETFRYDPTDATVLLDRAAPRYEATWLALPGGTELPEGTGAPLEDRSAFPEEVLEVDDTTTASIDDLTEEIVGDETNDLAKAIAIQNHFRTEGYTYSLELDPAAREDATDPIGGFLDTKIGYCVQYATTMVMMARHEGIPARMAVGFLPGEVQTDGSRKVVAANAHTWPELWIEGMGWTRFEPTPRVHAGPPPAYARTPAEGAAENETTTTTTRTITPSVNPTPPPTPVEPTWLDRLGEILPWLGRILLGALALALLMAIVPFVGRRYREAGLRSAEDVGEQVEGQWTLLTRSLQDLGVDQPPARSPRDMARHYEGETVLNRRSTEALGRVTATLERSRYAPPAATAAEDAERMREDVQAVVEDVRRDTPWNVRLNALLLPRSGMDGIRAWFNGDFRR